MSDTDTTTQPGTADEVQADPGTADEAGKAAPSRSKRPLVLGLVGGIVVGFLVVGLIGAFLWPGHAFGPGSPDALASEATADVAAKNSAALDAISCRGADGKPVAPINPQIFGVIGSVKPAGAANLLIDSEARVPVDLTIAVQGQQQPLPIDLVLGENDRTWCFKGLTAR
ncbi:hypothetical protein LQ327_14695 [Actinomycetospora endophytica]|uniref:MmpS family membrane protein n=1 Tax=Actinomycetospora endophytica TaxID=2291215 RepID=A0ABS8PC99_9PSEU|nr:hypothetical protein [Actinomycetospora endophytica]MCD2194619.1 hypothetical protein [Actinomycetospora endophytica]